MIKTAAALMLCLALASCADTAPKKRPVVTAQHMACSGNRQASLTLLSPDEARLTFEGQSYDLGRVRTANGIKYGNDTIAVWSKGVDSMILRDDSVVATCAAIPKKGL